MSRPALELADIFRVQGPGYRVRHSLPLPHLRVMRAIEVCRTAVLGGHVEECGHCSQQRIAYNSCRNRHCPKCQSLAREQWLERRKAELLPISYHHVVFTLPPALAAIALQNKETVYGILLRSSAETLLTIAADPKHLGAEIGFFSILHTWGQNLLHHPHVHCVVTGGGLSPDRKQWKPGRKGFFLSVRVLSRLFRRLFLEALLQADLTFYGQLTHLNDKLAFRKYLASTRKQDWVVYSKAPFGGPEQAIDYLGRYTHKIAISNHRLLAHENGQVRFQYKDYNSSDPQRSREMTLEADEFIRRFLLHVVPPGFQRIRHYGLLANRNRERNLSLCRDLLRHPITNLLPPISTSPGKATEIIQHAASCPKCKIGTMLRTQRIFPQYWPRKVRVDSS